MNIKPQVICSADRSNAVPLLQLFLVCVSMVSFVAFIVFICFSSLLLVHREGCASWL